MTDGTTGARADAVELLSSHHREVEQLWKRAQAARSTGEADLAADLGQRIISLLSQHDAIETQFLYPALRGVGDRGDQLADHSLEEHQRVRELLKAADGAVATDEGWTSLGEAIGLVEAHVHEEETEIFTLLRTAGQEELYELGAAMEAGMKTAPTHPHPSTPNNPVAATVVGAAAGIVDRIRDALTKR